MLADDDLALRVLETTTGDNGIGPGAALRRAAILCLQRRLTPIAQCGCGCRACGNVEGASCPAYAALTHAFTLATGQRPRSSGDDAPMSPAAERFYDALIAVFQAGHADR